MIMIVTKIKTLDTIKLSKMTSKEFYSILCSFKKSDLAVLLSWEEKFDVTVDFNWKNVLEFKLKTLKNNKVKQCNFKTIHRILPYRYNLCKWKVVSEGMCIFCLKTESFVYVLIECPTVSLFWKRIIKYVQTYFNKKLLLNEKLLIMGTEFNYPNAANINTVLIYAQYAIYKTYMLNYFQGKTYSSYAIWNTFKNEILLDNISDISNTLKTFIP